jgi:hypothetical protein
VALFQNYGTKWNSHKIEHIGKFCVPFTEMELTVILQHLRSSTLLPLCQLQKPTERTFTDSRGLLFRDKGTFGCILVILEM